MRAAGTARLATVASLLVAGAAAALAQDRVADGERQFKARCASCHSVEAGQNRLGPSLSGIFGRAAGSVEGARYSAAMKRSGIVWTPETLDDYLASPRQAVPGTSKPAGLPNAEQRGQVIEYLRRLQDGS